MSVLLVAELAGTALAGDAFAKSLSAARKLGPVTVLVAGAGVADAATEAAGYEGVAQVQLADAPVLGNGLAEPNAALLLSLATQHSHIVAAAGTFGRSVMPRLAALLDVMVLSDVTGIVDAQTFERPIYAGNAVQSVRSTDAVKVLTVRPTAFTASGPAVAPAPVSPLPLPDLPAGARWLRDEVSGSDRPQLTAASTVVSGGRGLATRENFALIEELADSLGGAVGASRAAVDMGLAPADWQVGQTGKIVAPKLYVAVGISGAIQHLAGMKDSGVIVAINKDEDAPIFQVADYGLVGDLFDLVPELTRALRG